jgi:DDHD domain
MPQSYVWDHVADAASSPHRVWFRRPLYHIVDHPSLQVEDKRDHDSAATDVPVSLWELLRKSDCRILNERTAGASQTNIECGRFTVNFQTLQARSNFCRSFRYQLCSATWFLRRKPDDKSPIAPHSSQQSTATASNPSDQAAREATILESLTNVGAHIVAPPKDATSSSGSESYVLEPILSESDTNLIELLYQRAITAVSSLGAGLSSVAGEDHEITLGNDRDKVRVVSTIANNNTVLQLKYVCPGRGPWGMGTVSYDLQRGYGSYVVDGELEETSLGPVQHLCFVIHGIGETMFSRSSSSATVPVTAPSAGVKSSGKSSKVKRPSSSAPTESHSPSGTVPTNIGNPSAPLGSTASLIHAVNRMRKQVHKKQYQQWQQDCDMVVKRNAAKVKTGGNSPATTAGLEPLPAPPGRIEFIPIEWFDQLRSSSTEMMRSLQAVTLSTIPALRAIANDVVFDVLLYLTPTFCTTTLQTVTEQIQTLHQRFEHIHPHFGPHSGRSGVAGPGVGKCSIIGHSLGSVIAWDLLSILKEHNSSQSQAGPLPEQPHQTWGPSLAYNGAQFPTLPFEPDFTMFLGSPLGIFLTLCGAPALFDQLRRTKQLQAADEKGPKTSELPAPAGTVSSDDSNGGGDIVSPFQLPSGGIYNVFHPSDPVAYRIEPLLLDPVLIESKIGEAGAGDSPLPPPAYVTGPGQDLRLHVKAKLLGDEIRKNINVQKNAWSSLIESAVSGLQTLHQAPLPTANKSATQRPLVFPLGGRSSRVDYSLQPAVIDNEYFSAITAHSSYFSNDDVQDFLIGLASGQH